MLRRPLAVLVLALLVAGLPAGAVARSPSPAASAPGITLEPVTEQGYGIASVAPVGWTHLGSGTRARGRDATDTTLLVLQSAPATLDVIWPALLQQFGVAQRPDPVATRTNAAGIEWSLFRLPTQQPGLTADLALAEGDGTSWIVVLLATDADLPLLHGLVFLPAVDAFSVVARPAATANAAWTEQEVTFPGGAPDVTLAGSLTVPSGPGPHPGVVLMTGSGPQDRDESLPGMDFRIFALVADALAEAGVAVLRYDDRGTARSTGDYASAVIDDFTADGAAALGYLRTRPEVDPARVGILGHSEGGAYIAAIAADDPQVAFVVGMAPMVRNGLDMLIDQQAAISRAAGASEADIAAARPYLRALLEAVDADDRERAESVLRAYVGDQYDRQDAATRTSLGDRETYIQRQVDTQLPTMFSPWYRSFLRSDPAKDWARVAAPVLGVFGSKDVQVVAAAEAPALEQALAVSADPRSRVVTLDDANHLFQVARTGSATEYESLAAAFTPELLPLITDWIHSVTGLDG